MITAGGGLDLARPTCDEWDMVATIPDVGLVAPAVRTRVVPLLLKLVHANVRSATVVAGENHQCVVGNAIFIDGIEHFAQRPVGLHHKITVVAQS